MASFNENEHTHHRYDDRGSMGPGERLNRLESEVEKLKEKTAAIDLKLDRVVVKMAFIFGIVSFCAFSAVEIGIAYFRH